MLGKNTCLKEIGPAVAVEGPAKTRQKENEHDVADGWPLGCDGHVRALVGVARRANHCDHDD